MGDYTKKRKCWYNKRNRCTQTGAADIGTAMYEDGGWGENTNVAVGGAAGSWAGAQTGGAVGAKAGEMVNDAVAYNS